MESEKTDGQGTETWSVDLLSVADESPEGWLPSLHLSKFEARRAAFRLALTLLAQGIDDRTIISVSGPRESDRMDLRHWRFLGTAFGICRDEIAAVS